MKCSARSRALTTVAALVVTGAVTSACSSGNEPSGAAGPAATSSVGSAPASRASPSGSAGPSRPPAGSGTPARTARPRTPAVETASPSVAIRTLPPADVGDPVPIARNVLVTVSNIRTTTVSGTGPGEVAGEAVAFAVEVRNRTTGTVDVGGFAVTASYGRNVPASPSNAAPSSPLTGSLKPGGVATGTYVFRMLAAQAGSLKVQVSSDSSPNIVVVAR